MLNEIFNPVQKFMNMLLEMWDAFPLAIKALIGLTLAVIAFFGLINMLRT